MVFHTVSFFTSGSEFCKLSSILIGEVNLTEFENVKQVSKNTYSLFNFLN